MIDSGLPGAKGGLRAAFFVVQRASLFDVAVFGVGMLCFVWSFLVGNHYPPWMNAYNDTLSACGLALLLAAVAQRCARLAVPPVAWGVALLAAVPLLQVAAGQILFFGDGWIAALYLLCLALAIIAGVNGQRLWPHRLVSSLCGGWVGVALLSCLIALVQRFNIDTGNLGIFVWDVHPGRAPFGNLGQPNQMATFFALALAALACLYESRKIGGPWALVAAALVVVCMAMTQSRAALLLLAGSLLALLAYRRRLSLRTPLLAVLLLMALWAASFFLLPALAEWIGLNSTVSVTSRMQAGPRTIIWTQLWEAALRQPWLGYGWNQVSVAQMSVAADFGITRHTEHSHNLLLDLVLWNGFPIALVLTGLSAWWFADRARRVRSVEGVFGLVFIGILLMHSMVEFPLEYLYFLLPFGLAVGIVEADMVARPGARAATSLPRGMARLLPWALGLTVALVIVDYAHFEGKYRDLRLMLARVGVPLVAAGDAPPQTQFTQLSALYTVPLIDVRPGMPAAQRIWMGRVALRHPYVPVLYRYALAQALNGDAASAELMFRNMKRLHGEPNYLDAKAKLRDLAEGPYPQLKALKLE